MIHEIKIIGFDLDQTLYPKSPLIDEAIQKYIYEVIASHKRISLDEAKELFCSYYPKISGSKTLKKLEIPNAKNVIQEALERADIDQFLVPDENLHTLLGDLKKRYGSLSLITGSALPICKKKLEKLGMSLSWFDYVSTGEISKSDGTAYDLWIKHFQKKDPSLVPGNFLYIGDRPSTDVDIPLSMGMQSFLVNTKKKQDVTVRQFRDVLDIASELL